MATFNERFPHDSAFDGGPDYTWYYGQVNVFSVRFPSANTFPPQNDPFADRFYFGTDATHGSDSHADGGRQGDYYSHHYDLF